MRGSPRVGIVGGGILGTVLSLRLAQAGAHVTLLERAPTLGGLAGGFDFGGHRVDRFYHVVVPSDTRMLALADELGISDQIRFSPVGVGFWVDGRDVSAQRHSRLPALPAAFAARTDATRLVRAAMSTSLRLRAARGRAPPRMAQAALRTQGRRAASGGPCWIHGSTAVTRSFRRRISGRELAA